MNYDQHDIELIQRYLDREMTDEEKKELEFRLKEDQGLQSLYREQKELIEGIRYHHLTGKLDQLRSLEAALPPVQYNGTSFLLSRYGKALAVAAALALVTISYLLINRPEDPADLYTAYFEPYPNVFEPTQRAAEESSDIRTTAFHEYDRGHFAEAAVLFEKLLSDKKEPEILLLLGNANLMINQDEAAKNNFLTLIRDFDQLDEQAKWFLSLCYLKQGDVQKAKTIWEELGDPKITYSEKARKLLHQVK